MSDLVRILGQNDRRKTFSSPRPGGQSYRSPRSDDDTSVCLTHRTSSPSVHRGGGGTRSMAPRSITRARGEEPLVGDSVTEGESASTPSGSAADRWRFRSPVRQDPGPFRRPRWTSDTPRDLRLRRVVIEGIPQAGRRSASALALRAEPASQPAAPLLGSFLAQAVGDGGEWQHTSLHARRGWSLPGPTGPLPAAKGFRPSTALRRRGLAASALPAAGWPGTPFTARCRTPS